MRRAILAVVLAAACGDNLPGPADGHLFEGRVWGGNLAVADGWVYFSTYGERDGGEHALWRVSRDGGAAEPIWVRPRGLFGFGLALADDKLYWTEFANDPADTFGVFDVGTSGGDETELARFSMPGSPYSGLSFDSGHVYAANGSQVLDVPASGGAATAAYSGNVSWMVHRGGHLYVLDGSTLLADGAPVTTLASKDGDFAVDDHAVYIGDGDTLRRIPIDSTTTRASVAVHGKPWVILATDGQVYADVALGDGQGNEELDRFDFDTGLTTTLETDLHFVWALAADDTSVYAAQCACSNLGFIARYDR